METPPIHVLLALDAQILGGRVDAEISTESTPTVTESSTGDEGSPVPPPSPPPGAPITGKQAAQDDGPGRQLDSDQYLLHGRQRDSGQSPVASV